MKVLASMAGLALLLGVTGCEVEAPPAYGGSYGAFYGEYPYTSYYYEGPFLQPYPYYRRDFYGRPHWHAFDRDHYFDRQFEHDHHFMSPTHSLPREHFAPRSGGHDLGR